MSTRILCPLYQAPFFASPVWSVLILDYPFGPRPEEECLLTWQRRGHPEFSSHPGRFKPECTFATYLKVLSMSDTTQRPIQRCDVPPDGIGLLKTSPPSMISCKSWGAVQMARGCNNVDSFAGVVGIQKREQCESNERGRISPFDTGAAIPGKLLEDFPRTDFEFSDTSSSNLCSLVWQECGYPQLVLTAFSAHLGSVTMPRCWSSPATTAVTIAADEPSPVLAISGTES